MSTTLKAYSVPFLVGEAGGALLYGRVNAHPTAYTFGAWNVLYQENKTEGYLYGLVFVPYISSVTTDTTRNCIMEIGFGTHDNVVTKIQIPFSYRLDTNTGYFIAENSRLFFPEQVYLPAMKTCFVRYTNSVGNQSEAVGLVRVLYYGTEQFTSPMVSQKNPVNFQSVSAGSGISVSERAW